MQLNSSLRFNIFSQNLNLKVAMSQQAEREAREDVDKLKLEIQTERAHVRAARDIEKHKQQQSLETKWKEFHNVTEDVNTRLDSLLQSFSQLSNVNVTVAGKSFGKIRCGGCTRVKLKISHLVASLPTACQQVVFALLVPICQQVWNNLLTTCNKLDGIIKLVTRLF
jgi:hypothetical protein